MTNIRSIDMLFLDDLFEMRGGYGTDHRQDYDLLIWLDGDEARRAHSGHRVLFVDLAPDLHVGVFRGECHIDGDLLLRMGMGRSR